jgi:dihydropteroate synthase
MFKTRKFRFKNRELVFDGIPKIMGILNVTPDSFSDGGKYNCLEPALKYGLEMLADGADIIDVGGESTRPGAEDLSPERELGRILPVIESLRKEAPDCIISVDTRKSEVAKAAVEAGADIINDVSGLQYSEEMAEAAVETGAGLILMHMRGTPESMQNEENLRYDDLIKDIKGFLSEIGLKAEKNGVNRESIMVDPGIGFSKTVEQNLEIIGKIREFEDLPYPLLVGPSRKSFIGKVLGEEDPGERKWGTAGVLGWLAMEEVDLVRVHDIKATKQVIKMFCACKKYSGIS